MIQIRLCGSDPRSDNSDRADRGRVFSPIGRAIDFHGHFLTSLLSGLFLWNSATVAQDNGVLRITVPPHLKKIVRRRACKMHQLPFPENS
ncbi:hypothetical protein CEXT_198331 [Caerostris extrusa]|uniref:Uncharacterized protein n=1 Tax=Caerostris extrusa TaxID=172846 RepID=A0AAV4UET6_CAEEX|nr:hypothetical protein CEXT_198331 [Caerostris extrusa]